MVNRKKSDIFLKISRFCSYFFCHSFSPLNNTSVYAIEQYTISNIQQKERLLQLLSKTLVSHTIASHTIPVLYWFLVHTITPKQLAHTHSSEPYERRVLLLVIHCTHISTVQLFFCSCWFTRNKVSYLETLFADQLPFAVAYSRVRETLSRITILLMGGLFKPITK